MAQRFNRPPHPEAPFHADRVADSAPPTRDELGAFSWRMRERAQRRSLAFAVAMTVAGTLVLATRHESGVAAFLNARIESIDLALYALAVVAVVIWGYTLFRLLDPIFSDWLGARADLEVIAEEAPEVKRVLVSTALINQAATGYMRALREDVDRELRAGDLRAMRQYLRQIKNPNTAGLHRVHRRRSWRGGDLLRAPRRGPLPVRGHELPSRDLAALRDPGRPGRAHRRGA